MSDTPSPADARAALVEKMARVMALCFTSNQQPDMSGNPFAKLLPHQKRNAMDAAEAALAVIEAEGYAKRDDVLEEAAKVAEDHSWMMDIEWWMTSTKKEISSHSAKECAAVIRSLSPTSTVKP